MNFGSRAISMFNRAAPKISRSIGQVADVGRNIGQIVKHTRNIGSIAAGPVLAGPRGRRQEFAANGQPGHLAPAMPSWAGNGPASGHHAMIMGSRAGGRPTAAALGCARSFRLHQRQ